MNIAIGPLRPADAAIVADLQRAVAEGSRLGLARRPNEISDDYILGAIEKAAQGGAALGAWDGDALVGCILAYAMGPVIFAHVWTDLTVAVHPQHQGRGVGRSLFEALFAAGRSRDPAIWRIELFAGKSNTGAIRLYESLGFQKEGLFPKRVRYPDGFVDDDIPMGIILA